ncbi:MAG: hypothetical protein ACO27U_10770 [Ilumatobacteraceae bacterium]
MTSTVALVGSWADSVDDRRSVAGELASVWPKDSGRISIFGELPPDMRDRLSASGVRCWPEGAFGRHFVQNDFDHSVLLIGPRLDSLLALGRSADAGCHVWLQSDVVDDEKFPIDAPDGWLVDVIAAARSVIVGSDWLAGVVRNVSPDGPPVLVMPPAHPDVTPIVETPGRVIVVSGDDEVFTYLADALSVSVVRLDDADMTPSVREARLLSARAGVEIRTQERGFASTTVTHMTARGIPTITTLGAHAPLASRSLSATGLVVLDDDVDPDLLVDHLTQILDDDREWLVASTAAKATAASWTWSDAADVLAQWMETVDDLEPSTVRVVGAVTS